MKAGPAVRASKTAPEHVHGAYTAAIGCILVPAAQHTACSLSRHADSIGQRKKLRIFELHVDCRPPKNLTDHSSQ